MAASLVVNNAHKKEAALPRGEGAASLWLNRGATAIASPQEREERRGRRGASKQPG